MSNPFKRCVTVIVGMQWGDEGKGKYAHIFSKDAKIVLRTTGGNNAGHTVVANGEKYAVHLLPSSIIRDDVKSIICAGVVVDPEVFNQEVEEMQNKGISISRDNLLVSNRAHIIFPFTKDMDLYYEYIKVNKVGTTKRGIGPCYADKMNRVGIRVGDLFLPRKELEIKVRELIKVPNILFGYYRLSWILKTPIRLLQKIFHKEIEEDLGFRRYRVDDLMQLCEQYKNYLKDFRSDVQIVIGNALDKGEEIAIEGAQAHSLDIEHGDYPCCTSSAPNASGSLSGAGIGPMYVKRVCGVMKAYCSRVGAGPFITKEDGIVGDYIREEGHEYGTTTGRPRDCGWLDLVHIKEAIKVSSVTELCINHIDTIGKVGLRNHNEILICFGYYYNSREISYVPLDIEKCIPMYERFEGWSWEEKPKTYEELPENCKMYIQYIEDYLKVPITYIGIGPGENDYIRRKVV